MNWKKVIKYSVQAASITSLLIGSVLTPSIAFANSTPRNIEPGAYQLPDQEISKTDLRQKFVYPSTDRGKKGEVGPSHPDYKMNVFYDSQAHTIKGTMTVRFTNNLNRELKDLYFNLWGNAAVFKENGGGMNVQSVQVNGKKADFELKETALHIQKISLKQGRKASVQMKFSVSVPHAQDRFGWYGSTVSLGNWFPILAVYDEEGWNIDPYFPYGESFYSLTGNFDVTVTTDKSQVIATTGTEVGKPRVTGNLATHRFKAKNVRDFAMEMDPSYHVKSGMAGKVKVNVYYTDQHAKFADAMLESGIDSINLFSEKFGQYPWPELDVVSMEGWFGGMEYPQLIMISITDQSTEAGVKSVTAHENGHQWFYGIIGNNEYDEPWLDESFATFSAALYNGRLDQLTTAPPDDPYYHLSSKVSDFTARGDEGIDAYYYTIYSYGARTLNDLRKELGDEQFYRSMQAYFKEKKFAVATTEDFMRIMEQTSGRDLSKFFAEHRVYLSDQQ
ncbi:M1 family metallopeptidase [Paenactinomyces guangxiensis]|uniref:M1 family metallopeptidase n=1 Tax=Paenactinomyces guangxiensis TaxID=1490290 RepID=A0A7W1WS54_9BACL|nr:M1 family metallopeptidase [Paenactinomyces guangxiensis]MBA4495051.1 M1 family metallopeptidase [Paenactinomyces guangxiensis]MBH8592265.1 M1 family metallopeptidase [Paenactinomyces guangxiensis]